MKLVVSAQRSGLNWVRYCIERFTGCRTPGKQLLLKQGNPCFVRSHDPLGARGKSGGAWLRVDPSATEGQTVVLLLRNHRESFFRMAEGKWRPYVTFLTNIKFFVASASVNKRVFYYEDFVAKPEAMDEVIRFLEASSPAYSLEEMSSGWEQAAEESRAAYSVNQAGAGGAMTRSNPFDFNFHTRSKPPTRLQEIDDFTRAILSKEELALLQRYTLNASASERS